MSEDAVPRKRLETKAIVVGYAMSRLDTQYLALRGGIKWETAYAELFHAVGRNQQRETTPR